MNGAYMIRPRLCFSLGTLAVADTSLLRDYFSSRGGDDLSHLLIGVTYTDTSETLKFPKREQRFRAKCAWRSTGTGFGVRSAAGRRQVGGKEIESDGKHQNVTNQNLF